MKKNQDEEINKEIVKSVISRGIPVEKFFELGGEIITLGSDSHRAIDVCADFDKSYEMLEYLGFRYVSVFKNRKCEFIPIYRSAYHTA